MGFALLLQKRYTRFGEEKTFKKRQRVLQIFGAIAVPLAMVVLLIVLYKGIDVGGWCSWCRYINCVPIPNLWTCDETGCSDDPKVTAIPYPNGTVLVTCPSSTNGKTVYTEIDHQPTLQDVIDMCHELCFS